MIVGICHKRVVQKRPVGYTEDMVKKSVKKPSKKQSITVDFEPNKMALAIAAAAAACLVLVAVIAMQG